MAKAEKLASGNWRVVACYMEDGKRVRKSFTASRKKDAEEMAQSYLLERKASSRGAQRLREAIDEFVSLKDGILSPTTLMNYKRMIHYYPERMLDKPLDQITKVEIDEWIKEQAAECSPKTVSNRYGFLHTIFKYNGIKLDEHKLPQKKQMTYVIPTDADIQKLLRYARKIQDDELVMIIMFGAFGGMRRGEMCGLTPADLEGNVLHIHNNKVQHEQGTIIKGTKTVQSDRYIECPAAMLKVIKGRTEFITSEPSTVSKKFKRALKACGLPDYRLHDLRHYCASVLHANGVPNVYIQKFGGWKNESVLNAIYRNTLADYEKIYFERMNDVFSNISE